MQPLKPACTAEYRGRFAPSPTGPIHFGSVVTALASYLDARAHDGAWLVRIEDLDKPREQPGAAESILMALTALGMQSDEPVVLQSQRAELYRTALDTLKRTGLVYGCACARRDIAECHCHDVVRPGRLPRAWRFRAPAESVSFNERRLGWMRGLARDTTVLRADGIFAYALAVVVDDADQGITHVVRGADLLETAAAQVALQTALGVASPEYLHVPLVVDERGRKLSKQNHAPPVDLTRPAEVLRNALQFLGQPDAAGDDVHTILKSATANWSPETMPQISC
ncbi:MAG TPA: tRNA glutamyl-Q(34) synthetase GluQRS [Bryobacteraceae bacterium]|nr:tRNA glutamyl-Q(34) synthetase GluQRS [Bryobacteraceae bacterium]